MKNDQKLIGSHGGDEALNGQNAGGVKTGNVRRVNIDGLVSAKVRWKRVMGSQVDRDHGVWHCDTDHTKIDGDAVGDEGPAGGAAQGPVDGQAQ